MLYDVVYREFQDLFVDMFRVSATSLIGCKDMTNKFGAWPCMA